MENAEGNKLKFIEEPLKERLKKNSITNILYFVLTFPLAFIMTPLILKYVGKELYGVWVLAGTIMVFFEIVCGFQTPTALGIMVPKYNPAKDEKHINEIVNTLFIFYFFISIVFFTIFYLLKNYIISTFFKVTPEILSITEYVLIVGFAIFFINFTLTGFTYLLGGFNLFYYYNILHIVFAFIRIFSLIFLLYAGFGIKAVVYSQMGTIFLENIIIIFLSKKIYPYLRFGFQYFNLEKLKIMLILGAKIIVNKLYGIVGYNVDKLVLGYFLNPVFITYYQIGSNVARYISFIPDMLGLYSLIPATSELQSRNENIKIANLYWRVNKYMFFIGILICSGILFFGQGFVLLWLGSGFDDVARVMKILSVAYLIGLAGFSAVNILNGMERIRETFIVSLIGMIVNIVASIICTRYFGLIGALISTSITISIISIIMIIIFYRITKIGFNFIQSVLKPFMSAFLVFGIFFLIKNYISFHENWFVFFILVFLYTGVYLFLNIFIFKTLDEYDLKLFGDFIFRKRRNE